MYSVTFTEFRKHAAGFLDKVDRGEEVIITRHKKPLARLIPYHAEETSLPSWQNKALRLKIKGIALSKAIIEDREKGK